jgi:ABC-2 type transport system ATP-binding protein
MTKNIKEKEVAVSIKNVSKSFRLPTESSNSLRTTLVNRMKGIKGYSEQKVLKDISFDVEKGDFLVSLVEMAQENQLCLKLFLKFMYQKKGMLM